MKTLLFILLILCLKAEAQNTDCSFQAPAITIDFGSGVIEDLNTNGSYAYSRILGSCPSDGHYTFTSSTNNCFRGDWQSLPSDHTGNGGNMMIVNASYRNGYFLTTRIKTLKPGTIYEFGVWMLNVCRLTDKCPFPLLPNITIQLRTLSGNVVGQLETGEVARLIDPKWSQYKFVFTTPASDEDLVLTMIDNIPGGCGNDFALDDITFRECIKIPPKSTVKKNAVKKPVPKSSSKPGVVDNRVIAKVPVKHTPKPEKNAPPEKTSTVAVVAKKASANKPVTQKTPVPKPERSKMSVAKKAVDKKVIKPDTTRSVSISGPSADAMKASLPVITDRPIIKERPTLAPPPAVLLRRENEVYKKIQASAGEIRIDLYDNGEIDGDTVTIYHNNKLVVSRARLSAQPITIRIAINPDDPHHEIVMVANNLGSIPPNTSLMVVNAGGTRHEVYTSSNERKNAKVVFDLKQ